MPKYNITVAGLDRIADAVWRYKETAKRVYLDSSNDSEGVESLVEIRLEISTAALSEIQIAND